MVSSAEFMKQTSSVRVVAILLEVLSEERVLVGLRDGGE